MEENVKYPHIVAPSVGPAISPAEFAKGHDTVTMVFQKNVLFTPSHGTRVQFAPGVHEVPRHLADHWYLRNNGATVYAAPVAAGAVASSEKQAPVKSDKKAK